MISELQALGFLGNYVPSGSSPPKDEWEFLVGRKDQFLTAMLGPSQSPAHPLLGSPELGVLIQQCMSLLTHDLLHLKPTDTSCPKCHLH